MAEKQTSKDRMREIVDSIENGIKELFESDKYRQYLSTMSRFHRYSVNNTMLIYMQRPDATHVAGFNKWRDQFGRNVLKGEKGIRIIAPTPYKKKIEEIKTDPETNAPVLDADGKAIIEEKEIRIPMFKVVSVFDVSQTAGKPLPQLAADLSGNVQQYEVFMEALRRASPVPMEIKPVARDTDGFFSIKAQSITIRAGMSEVQTVCAAVHEIAHAKLHDYEHMTELADDGETILVPGEKSRNTEEVEAESISYAVCQYYGIETGENSFGYIATWSKGKELKELRASLETINKTASELITDIDRHFAEICKERGIDREDLAAAEQPSVEAQEVEKLYMVDNDKYIHVQRSDTGIDYTIYDAGSAKVLDGGVLDGTEQQLSTAALEVCKLHNIGEAAPIRLAPLELLKDLREANELPLDAAEQITGAVAVPTDAADTMLPELEQAVPMPDPTLTVDDMRSYGYLDSDMLPLSKDRAVELLEHDITVYMLYPDNAEEMVFEAEDIIKHDGMFGVTRPDWDAVKGHIPPRDVEQRFLNSPTDSMAIYQLRRDAPVELRFANLGSLAAPPDPANYEAVYTREVYPDDDTGRILENFYYIFNDERPGDFVGHSLSVSDIVALKQNGKVSYHYCDSMGFQELPAFQKPENYLKAAEMSMEDDYGMIDGIINNGSKQPTVANLEAQVKAGMSISLMDLAAAAHRERDAGERKPSVLEQLKNQPVQERPHKTAPKKSAEKEL
ncbi:MAG: YodL domain-containing protein [Blautia sp.]